MLTLTIRWIYQYLSTAFDFFIYICAISNVLLLYLFVTWN